MRRIMQDTEIVSIRGINGGTNRKVMNDVYFQVVEVGSWE